MKFQDSTLKDERVRIKQNCEIVVVAVNIEQICYALSAAYNGVKVGLIFEGETLGRNVSSELRLLKSGANFSLTENSSFKEKIDLLYKILHKENLFGKENNPVLFDMFFLEEILKLKNLSIYFNTEVHKIVKYSNQLKSKIFAYSSEKSVEYYFEGKFITNSFDYDLGIN
jgi:hypothetical protein